MQRAFLDRFDFGPTWQGPRASEFRLPSDAFQQLIGDALKESFDSAAWVASTAGRDGSIDAVVDASTARAPVGFESIGFPLIVECKCHDENAKNLKHNIDQEWKRVEQKLIKQAEAGWTGAYEPWQRAGGYLYCVSARFPDAAFRENFRQRIRNFFNSLAPEQKPPFDDAAIHIWDWSDLASWLRHSGRLADRWLGVPADYLLDHAAFRRRIGQPNAQSGGQPHLGFRAYLLSENLPFVPPETDHDTHPENLLALLTSGQSVLLTGEGGIGKTRTSFEVAEQADRAQWRVLHLEPPELNFDPRALLDELFAHTGRTLVVVDYIDKVHGFDARFWRTTIQPEIERRGGQLVLIANARPADSAGLLDAVRASGLFREIHIAPTPVRRAAIVQQIESRLCPTAVATLGQSKVRDLCGTRPIIAMFIAHELEVLAARGALVDEVASLPPPGDLLAWLHRRLRESEMLPMRRRLWTKIDDLPALCAAAALLAAAPLSEAALINVAEATLLSVGADISFAPRYLGLLKTLGWLEPHESELDLRTPHDIVADEVLGSLLSDDACVLPNVFSGAALGRPLGRFALAVSRLAARPDRNHLVPVFGDWMAANAASLGTRLTEVEADHAAYAYGAVLDCPPWIEVATSQWRVFVEPWLEAHGKKIAARHLLHRGLKLPDATHRLRDAALSWLAVHAQSEAAGFVLGPLLAWDEGRLGEAESEALGHAMSWLALHAQSEPAQFVLYPLLAWDERQLGEAESEALGRAMSWLALHAQSEAAGFVLPPLLAWDGKRLGEAESKALGHAMSWLGLFEGAKGEDFVLVNVVARRGLAAADRSALCKRAVNWVRRRLDGGSGETHLLRALLQAANWYEDEIEARDVVILAGHWLDRNEQSSERAFVMTRLLRNRALPDRAWAQVAQSALQESARSELRRETDYLLNSALNRFQLLPAASRDCWLTELTRWLAGGVNIADANNLLRNCRRSLIDPRGKALLSDVEGLFEQRMTNL